MFALQLFYRHHTNPVGTEWKWKMDDPDTIVNGAMDNHRNMIKQFRGTKGLVNVLIMGDLDLKTYCKLTNL